MKLLPTNMMTRRLTASLTELETLEQCVAAFLATVTTPVPAQARYDFWLALHETFVNIIEHAYAGANGVVFLRLACSRPPAGESGPTMLVAHLQDHGRPFDRSAPARPEPGALAEGGYGLFLVHQLLDEVTYTRKPGGNTWRLVKKVAA